MQLEGFRDVSALMRCGIYALCFHGEVVYIGKSKNLYSRIYTHRSLYNAKIKGRGTPRWIPVNGIRFDEVHIIPCSPDRMDALEYEMINKYRPRLNKRLISRSPLPLPDNLTFIIRGTKIVINPTEAMPPLTETIPVVRRV